MQVRDVMTADPVVCEPTTSLADAAALMRDRDIGDVLVGQDGRVDGIVTDRDMVIRGVASGGNVSSMTLGEICSSDVTCVQADADVNDVVRMMSEQALRRVPVMDGDRAIGIVSIGDLAVERDPQSALGRISSAPPQD
jgi:CBS domain-containing protein